MWYVMCKAPLREGLQAYTLVMKSLSTPLTLHLKKKQERFRRLRGPEESGVGIGEFFFLIEASAPLQDVYLPISIASGKKPAGFVYQIEGTTEGALSTTDISCSGEGTTQITLGTLLYCKIPKGKTATFRILVEIRGRVGKEYKVVISKVHYKHSTSDARYQKLEEEIRSDALKLG